MQAYFDTDSTYLTTTTFMDNVSKICTEQQILIIQPGKHTLLNGQLENTESGNGIRERKRNRTIRAHAHDLNEWAGQLLMAE